MENNTVPYVFVEIRIVCQYIIVQEIPDKWKLDVQHKTIPKYADLTTSSIFPFHNQVFYSVLLSTLSLYDFVLFIWSFSTTPWGYTLIWSSTIV